MDTWFLVLYRNDQHRVMSSLLTGYAVCRQGKKSTIGLRLMNCKTCSTFHHLSQLRTSSIWEWLISIMGGSKWAKLSGYHDCIFLFTEYWNLYSGVGPVITICVIVFIYHLFFGFMSIYTNCDNRTNSTIFSKIANSNTPKRISLTNTQPTDSNMETKHCASNVVAISDPLIR